ncbi:MAG: hypothetical protein MI802_23595, partial [Desulfobacterales bacterium]|nr:hypothetical protein [Desulfobacterales bacterium]
MAYTRLDINLTTGTSQKEDLSDELICRYLGGRGLNARLIRNILKENNTDKISAFDPANVITMSCGLLTGTGAPSGARMHLNTVSPLTDILGSSNIGGDAGTRLRALGLFSVVISGQADTPVWIHLHKDGTDIHPAGHLWGLSTGETEQELRKTLPGDSTVMSIGPAGENRCAFACIMSGNHHAAGRTGIGAVMGAKNIKAIVITGKKEVPKLNIAQKATVRIFTRKIMKAPLYPVFSKLSNSGFVIPINEKGMLSTRNYSDIRFEGAEKVDGSAMMEYVQKSATCPKCPVHCKADIKISEGRYQGTTGARPDLEPIIALGPKCGLDDPEAILYLHNLCNRLGLDVISAGSVAAFAMDLFNRGIIDTETTSGIDLSWGNADGLEQLLNAIANNKGIGSTLKLGVHKAAQAIGNG